MELWTRRKFFAGTLAGSALAGAGRLLGKTMGLEEGASARRKGRSRGGVRPVMISSANGLNALGKGMEILKGGGDTLDAAVAAVTIVEDDPNDDSVGYGGLPNEEGVVELDASVMHGPTRRAGSVASVQKIKNVARLAKTVMERTNHVMIVGDGARRFAVAEGFEEQNLLTEHSRKIWLAWKAKTSFNWRPGIDSPEWKEYMAQLFDGDAAKIAYAEEKIAHPRHGNDQLPGGECQGRSERDDDDFGIVVEDSGARGRFAGDWRGSVCGWRRGRGGVDGEGRGEYQGVRRAHDRGDDAQGHEADGCVPGGAGARGAELQRG